jgi:polyphenol oxidase
LNPDWLTPQWLAPPHVKAVFTSRAGGVSLAPFDSLNLGDHVGDDLAHVMANRQLLQTQIPAKPVYLKQVHGTDVVRLDETVANGKEADACMTTQKNLACTIMVADCLPVLLTDLEGRFVAAAHAGWRGLAHGVLNQSISAILNENYSLAGVLYDYKAAKIIAWLGPCIGSSAFEVGAEVKAEFAAKLPNSAPFFTPVSNSIGEAPLGKYLADLAGLARLNLQQLGLLPHHIFGNDSSDEWCTASNPLRYFSYRRDAVRLGSSGRMAACIWLDDAGRSW